MQFGIPYESDARQVSASRRSRRVVDRVRRARRRSASHRLRRQRRRLELRFWIPDPKNGVANVKSEVLLQIWDCFRAHGFEFPSPQREVHITTPVEVRVRGAEGASEAGAPRG